MSGAAAEPAKSFTDRFGHYTLPKAHRRIAR